MSTRLASGCDSFEFCKSFVSQEDAKFFGIISFKKMKCEITLVPFPDGHLIPGVMLPKIKNSSNPALFKEEKDQRFSDQKMLDRFIFYHEDSHCDAVSWSSAYTDDIKNDDSDKMAFNSMAEKLSSGIRNAAAESLYGREVLMGFSPEQYSKILIGERYGDSRAALHLGQFMLIQKGDSIEDFERVIGLMQHIRKNEESLSKFDKVMNNHDTASALNETLRVIKNAHAEGNEGLQRLFGLAASNKASISDLQNWNTRSSVIAREITTNSMNEDGNSFLKTFNDRLSLVKEADKTNIVAPKEMADSVDVQRIVNALKNSVNNDKFREKMR